MAWGKQGAAFLQQEGAWVIVRMRALRPETDKTSFPPSSLPGPLWGLWLRFARFPGGEHLGVGGETSLEGANLCADPIESPG